MIVRGIIMAFEVNELSGSLFENDKKTNDRQPDFTGNCKIEGTMYWVSAWVKETRAGGDFLSLAFTAQDDQPSTVRESKPKGSKFLGKKRQGNSAQNEQRQKAKSKFEKEKAEYEAMTGKNADFRSAEDYDDDIPF